MIETPRCPVCDASKWEPIGERVYRSETIENSDDYVRRRLRVLFEVWFPGETSVTLRSLLCGTCGFVTYAPRPETKDIDGKYHFLETLGPGSGGTSARDEVEQRRARRLWKKLSGRIPNSRCRILDFGGGDGRLMAPFVERGHECCVVDYSTNMVAGVRHLASTLDELPCGEEFDLIVCSHVIEHVGDPLDILRRLRELLKESGSIYVEVPLEIWCNAPLQIEPVTHVNFFTTESMRQLLARAGFGRSRVRMEGYVHPLGHRIPVITAIATGWGKTETVVVREGAADATRRLLRPTMGMRVRRAMINPSRIPGSVLNKLRGALSLQK